MTPVGGHVSAAGGVDKTFARAQDIGASCFQIFGASPRQWRARTVAAEDAAAFKKAQQNTGIGPVFLHAAYLVNLASEKEDLRAKSVRSLKDHLAIGNALGANGLIFHPGSATDGDEEAGITRVAAGMNEVLADAPGTIRLLVENTAGGGTKLGESPQHIAAILAEVKNSARAGACFDTAHAFEGGSVDFMHEKQMREALDEWERVLGLDRIVVVHANDSKTAFASHHDKHENIGEGHIGTKGFTHLAADGRLAGVPWILETPGFDGGGPDAKNVERLKKILNA